MLFFLVKGGRFGGVKSQWNNKYSRGTFYDSLPQTLKNVMILKVEKAETPILATEMMPILEVC